MQHKLPGYAMLAVLLGGLSMVSPFSIDTFFPAFHAMEKALQVDAWQLQQVLTAYMLPFAFASLVHGPLSDAVGRRPVMIWGMGLYTVGSIACTLAPNYPWLIGARVLQGVTAGVGVVIGRAIVRDLYEGARAQRLMSLMTMIFSIAPAVAPVIGGWAHVAFGWRAVFAVMVTCGLVFTFSAWWRLPETLPPTARIPFNGRNLVATSLTVLRHPEFLMLAMAAALNFNSIACFIGSAPAIVETHWHMDETSYWMLFLPVISGILVGAVIAGYTAGRFDLVFQVRVGFGFTFMAALVRVLLHLLVDDVSVPVQQALLFFSAIGAQFAFPILTLRMLDLFPAARGTAAATQSFVALVFTAFTLGIIAPKVLPHLEWIAWASLGCSVAAITCWSFSRRWHDRAIPHHA
ncbi:MAG TPA: multidrug effflux MFS transporter [Steroidobacteraceae bacterium]|nr:multidrug effflux MFS transporter [Steroidobacteraceae bacterium]